MSVTCRAAVFDGQIDSKMNHATAQMNHKRAHHLEAAFHISIQWAQANRTLD